MKIRVGFLDFWPMANSGCPRLATFRISNRCYWPGLAVEIWQMLASQGNFTVEPVYFQRATGQETWALPLNALYKGEIDSLGLTFEKTQNRQEMYNFSEPLYKSTTKMAVRRADNSMTSIFDFFMVYSPLTWVAICSSLLFFMCFGAFVRFLEFKLQVRKEVKIGDFVWRMVRLQLIQYYKIEFRLMAGTFSLGIFALLQCAIILSLYQSYIISSVVRFKNPKPFKPEDFVWQLEQKKYSLIAVSKFDWIYDKIAVDSSDVNFYDVRQALVENPLAIVDDDDQGMDLVEKGRHVLIYQSDDEISFKSDVRCSLVFLNSPFPQENQHFLFRPNYPHINKIDKAIKEQKILIMRAYRKYMSKRYDQECNNDRKPQPLSFTPYTGLVALFLIGLSIGAFAFGFEIMYASSSSKNKHENGVD